MKNNNKVEIFAGSNAPDSRLGLLWLDSSDSTPYLKIVENSGKTKIVGGSYFELTTSLSESSSGKALDAVAGKAINDSVSQVNDRVSQVNEDINSINANKYPSIGPGRSGTIYKIVIESLLSMGFSIHGADLSNADLTGLDMSVLDLSGMNMNTCVFNGVDLTGSNLSNCDMTNADLSSADLTSANLSNANLSGAVLTSSTLDTAIINGINLTGATGLDPDINVALLLVSASEDDVITWVDGSDYEFISGTWSVITEDITEE